MNKVSVKIKAKNATNDTTTTKTIAYVAPEMTTGLLTLARKFNALRRTTFLSATKVTEVELTNE